MQVQIYTNSYYRSGCLRAIGKKIFVVIAVGSQNPLLIFFRLSILDSILIYFLPTLGTDDSKIDDPMI